MSASTTSNAELLNIVSELQDGLVSFSTSGIFEGGSENYRRLREIVLNEPKIKERIPEFVSRYRDLPQYWQFIKKKFGTYAERRQYLWDAFSPILDFLESLEKTPGVAPITDTLEEFDAENVHAIWQKALNRRGTDPEGAITAARSLLETTCKFLLDEFGITYKEDADPAKLWAMCAEALNLAPHQHTEGLFKAILGNCQSVVNGIASIRNKVGDAHGKGRKAVRPKSRHAELVVNLAGSMASFLIATWKEGANKPNSIDEKSS